MKKILVTRSSMPDYDEYVEMIKPLWDSRWLTNMGTYHSELEKKLKEFLQVKEVSLMVNGHMSLEMAIQAMDFPKGSQVITTPFTFISTTHAIIRNGLEPVFCDIKLEDYTMDESRIEELITEKTVAIVPVHVYGNICNIDRIQEIAQKHNLKVIYDACHAFGESYKGTNVSNYGDASVFSFHATKVFNTVEGGAVTSSSKELYDRLYNLKNFGIRGEELIEDVGANAKLNELSAIMGICNLKNVENNILLRKERVDRYLTMLQDVTNLSMQKFDRPDVSYNYGYFPIMFKDKETRDKVSDALKENNIFPRKYFYPLTSDAECFHDRFKDADIQVARYVSDRILVVPLYPELDVSDIDRICSIIKETV